MRFMRLPKPVKVQLLDKLIMAAWFMAKGMAGEVFLLTADIAITLRNYDNTREKENTFRTLSRKQLQGLHECLPSEFRKVCLPIEVRRMKSRYYG